MGLMTHQRYKGFNKLEIEGSEIIQGTYPDTNVLFVSNHQTYFADVVAMLHVFNASLAGQGGFNQEPRLPMATPSSISTTWRPKRP